VWFCARPNNVRTRIYLEAQNNDPTPPPQDELYVQLSAPKKMKGAYWGRILATLYVIIKLMF